MTPGATAFAAGPVCSSPVLTHPPDLGHPLRLDHAPRPGPGTLGLDAQVDFFVAVSEGLYDALELPFVGVARQHTDVRQCQQIDEAVTVHSAGLPNRVGLDLDTGRPDCLGKSAALGHWGQ